MCIWNNIIIAWSNYEKIKMCIVRVILCRRLDNNINKPAMGDNLYSITIATVALWIQTHLSPQHFVRAMSCSLSVKHRHVSAAMFMWMYSMPTSTLVHLRPRRHAHAHAGAIETSAALGADTDKCRRRTAAAARRGQAGGGCPWPDTARRRVGRRAVGRVGTSTASLPGCCSRSQRLRAQ